MFDPYSEVQPPHTILIPAAVKINGFLKEAKPKEEEIIAVISDAPTTKIVKGLECCEIISIRYVEDVLTFY